jgi:hypothetical protein
MRHAEANSASARSDTKGSARATERRGCAEATATETTSASNWSSPAAPADDMATTTEASSHSSSAAVITTTLRLPDQGRARKQCDPIQFSFHDLDFLCVFV